MSLLKIRNIVLIDYRVAIIAPDKARKTAIDLAVVIFSFRKIAANIKIKMADN